MHGHQAGLTPAHVAAGAGGSGSVDGFGSSLYGSGPQSGSSPPGSARSTGGTGQGASLAQSQGFLVPIAPAWNQGSQQPAPGECWPCRPSQCLEKEVEAGGPASLVCAAACAGR